MTPGGGRGWFHRKRHEPDPEQSSGTTHAGASPQPRDIGSTDESVAADALAPHHDLHTQWSPEARRTPPVPSPIEASGASLEARPPETTEHASNTEPAFAPLPPPHQLVAAPIAPFASVGTPPDRADEGAPPARPDTRDSPTPSATGQPVSDDPHAPNFRIAEPSPPRPSTRIDWDAATAAALSEESEPQATAGTPHVHSESTADRLLEDIIREIVGDAAADTVSALHPARTTPPTRDDTPPTGDRTTDTDADARLPSQEEAPEQPRAQREAEHDVDTLVQPSIGVVEEARLPVMPVAVDTPDRSWSTEPDRHAASTVELPATPPTESIAGIVETPPAPSSPASDREPAAAAPDDSDSLGVDRPTQPLSASWPTEASIAAATTGLPADVSRETIERPLDLPVSRETGTEHGGTPLADQLADETRRRLALDTAVLPLPPSTRILTISNQKGGVGKTTTAVNLAAALARAGAHVLVVDLDPQGNASTALGVDHRSEQQSVYEVLVSDLPLAEVIRPSTEHEHLDCVPATIHLAGAEIELVSLVAREQRLRRALDTHLASMKRPYDYVFIDCPPSLGLLTINAFVAAREVLIPIQCEYYALEGLSQLLSNIELIEKHLNSDLRLSTILLTMYDSRTNLAQQVAQEVRDHFPSQTLDTIIPRSVRVSEAPSYGQSVISYDFASSGSLSYREAAAEIARRSVPNPKETTDGN